MTLDLTGYIELPPHVKTGGFDHAAVHTRLNLLYVAHTANDALDVMDCAEDRYLRSIPGLSGVAGALVTESEGSGLVFTSNRAENTVGIFSPEDEQGLTRIPVGIRPNGLAYDPNRGVLLSAHVGDPAEPGSTTVALIQVAEKRVIATIPVPGRTRWTIFDADTDVFYVNIADPAVIVAIAPTLPAKIIRTIPIPASGPHGLDIDSASGRLFCACDGSKLAAVDIRSGDILTLADISGPPDVIFYHPLRQHLYVAVGDPGVIDLFDTRTMTRIQTIATEPGAHTLALDSSRSKVYAFLPQTHRAAVYVDRE